MTQRKPPGVRFETWVEKQIREATERGEFDDLPGAGRPIADLHDDEDDEDWWIKQKLRRENVTFLPPSLVLRKDAEDALARCMDAPSEVEARRIIEALNERILEAIRKPIEGPPHNLMPYDVDRVVARWHDRHPPVELSNEATEAPDGESTLRPRRGWVRRRRAAPCDPRAGRTRP